MGIIDEDRIIGECRVSVSETTGIEVPQEVLRGLLEERPSLLGGAAEWGIDTEVADELYGLVVEHLAGTRLPGIPYDDAKRVRQAEIEDTARDEARHRGWPVA